MSNECVGCHTAENLKEIEGFFICPQCDSQLDKEIQDEKMTKTETKQISYSDIESQQIFVIGTPAEIKAKQKQSKSTMDSITSKIDKIKAGMDRDRMFLDRKQKKLDTLEPQLHEIQTVDEANVFLKKKEFAKATLFGFSADGELRVKIGGKWFNDKLQEFVKVAEKKMTKKMEIEN